MTETIIRYGREFARTKDGGWLEVGAKLPEGSRARICGDAVVLKEAAKNMHGGLFNSGLFKRGWFYDGFFDGGEFNGGGFCGGEFHGGLFLDGWFYDGFFDGGIYHSTPCTATRSDGLTFVGKVVDGDLRIWTKHRDFAWQEAVAHWSGGHPHSAESQRIIHFLKAQAEAEWERDQKR